MCLCVFVCVCGGGAIKLFLFRKKKICHGN